MEYILMDRADRLQEAKNEFMFIVSEYILPLLPTKGKLQYRNVIPSHPLKKHINYYVDDKRINIYPCLNNPQFHFRINTQNAPQLGTAEFIIREIMSTCQYIYNNPVFPSRKYYDRKINNTSVYRNVRFDLAFEIGLCNWLGGISVFRLLEKLHYWAQRTYEGKRMPFSFIIDATNKTQGVQDFIHFMDSNHSAVFTDGMSSGIALDNAGQIIKYFSATDDPYIPSDDYTPLVPFRFRDFANYCYTDKTGSVWVGIISQTNGDILILKTRTLFLLNEMGNGFILIRFAYFQQYLNICMLKMQ